MRKPGRSVEAFLFAFCLAICAGCSTDIGQEDVAGTVNFAGSPVNYGHIEFVADTEKGNTSPSGSAEIRNGRYNTAETGRGVVPGAYHVRITGYDQEPPSSEDETKPTVSLPPLFNGFTIDTEVKGGEQNFDVPESARGFDMFKQNTQRSANEP